MKKCIRLWSALVLVGSSLSLTPSAIADVVHGDEIWGWVNIPDNGGWDNRAIWELDISGVPAGCKITSVTVRYRITHSYCRDLIVEITNESAHGYWHSYRLWDRASGVNIDQTNSGITSFNKGNPNGTWYLVAWDNAAQDVGRIEEWEIWVYYDSPKPDLIVTSVRTEPASPTEGQSYVVKCIVKNQGNAVANATGLDQWINCRFYIGSKDLGGERQWCTSIPVNGEYTFSSSSKTAPAAGGYTIKAVADSQGDVAESNESNNEKTASITIVEFLGIQLALPLPDLTDKNYLPNLDADRCDDWNGDGEKDAGWTINSSRCFAPGDTILIHGTIGYRGSSVQNVRMTAYYNRTQPSSSGWAKCGSSDPAEMRPPYTSPITGVIHPGLPEKRFVLSWTAPSSTGKYYIYVQPEVEVNGVWTPAEGAWVDGDASGDVNGYMTVSASRPVILVHGWGGSRHSFANLEMLIENGSLVRPVRMCEYATARVDFGSDSTIHPRIDLPGNGKPSLSDQIQSFCDNPEGKGPNTGWSHVDVVAHSMGGLVARQWALRESKIHNLILLGTPNYGGNLADSFSGALNNQAEDLEFGSAIQVSLFVGWKEKHAHMPRTLAVIGTDDGYPGIYNTSDGIVMCHSASLENLGYPAYYVPSSHINAWWFAGGKLGLVEITEIEDPEHPSWLPIQRFLSGSSYPFVNGPGNSGNDSDVGHRNHPQALTRGGMCVVARSGVDVMRVSSANATAQKETQPSYSVHWDGDRANAMTAYAIYPGVDSDDSISGTASFTSYNVALNLSPFGFRSQQVNSYAGETVVADFDVGSSPNTPLPPKNLRLMRISAR